MNGNDARAVAYRLLFNCSEKKTYSNIALDGYLKNSGLAPENKRFAAALAYGTLERLYTLDRIIAEYSNKPVDKLSIQVRCALQLGFYQLLYMDSVPQSAAVNESVKLVKRYMKDTAAAGYVNGVLRSFIRSGMKLPEAADKLDGLAMRYSCPPWLVHKWFEEYTENQAMSLLESSVGRPTITVRVNTLKCSAQELAKLLSADGFETAENKTLPNCLDIVRGEDIENSNAYREGLFHVQDISSQICCQALELSENDTLIDVCSAPGGKAFTCAELMNGKGSIIACDLHEKRVALIKRGAQRLGLNNITASVNDARKLNSDLPKADKVLCDVVCSGLGVIRRKPEIKYKSPDELKRLPDIQYEILKTSSQYVKDGGVLVYSTCTVSKAENERVVERFLQENKDFEPVSVCEELDLNEPFVTMTPDMFGGDGFFIAKLKRVK